jgi:hypothetical protein
MEAQDSAPSPDLHYLHPDGTIELGIHRLHLAQALTGMAHRHQKDLLHIPELMASYGIVPYLISYLFIAEELAGTGEHPFGEAAGYPIVEVGKIGFRLGQGREVGA